MAILALTNPLIDTIMTSLDNCETINNNKVVWYYTFEISVFCSWAMWVNGKYICNFVIIKTQFDWFSSLHFILNNAGRKWESILAALSYVRLIKVLKVLKICYSTMGLFSISCCFENFIVNKAMLRDLFKQKITSTR
jgi:hypothetical protein